MRHHGLAMAIGQVIAHVVLSTYTTKQHTVDIHLLTYVALNLQFGAVAPPTELKRAVADHALPGTQWQRPVWHFAVAGCSGDLVASLFTQPFVGVHRMNALCLHPPGNLPRPVQGRLPISFRQDSCKPPLSPVQSSDVITSPAHCCLPFQCAGLDEGGCYL